MSLEEFTVDAVIVGAGFSGMYMAYKLRSEGLKVKVIEAGDDVGGTWYWNRYPGARCDIESMEYSYQFSEELQQQWQWSERYSAQPEILRYANHVADKFELRRHIAFSTKATSAVFDEVSSRWSVTTDKGDIYDACFFVLATGCLSSTNLPQFEGLDDYKGDWYHTGQWPHQGVDFSGKRVAVVGTGSSAIQSIPHIAEQAEHLTVFQRTANFSVPAHNGPLKPEFVKNIKDNYVDFRQLNSRELGGFGSAIKRNEASVLAPDNSDREATFEEFWNVGGFGFMSSFSDLGMSRESNKFAADFVRDKIRAKVDDPETAELLCPDQVIGCKRLCVDINYFETYNRDNVKLVSVKDQPIERISERGLITAGTEYEFDAIVFATGFDAMTGSISKIDIRGRDGQTLNDKWAAGPRTYLGLQSHGFPNLFTISGPGSPSVLTNMVVSIEQHVNWIAGAIVHLRQNDLASIEAELEAENTWVDHTNEVADMTLMPSCNSWYLGANVPGKPRVFMPYVAGFPVYADKCEDVVAKDYEGFSLS